MEGSATVATRVPWHCHGGSPWPALIASRPVPGTCDRQVSGPGAGCPDGPVAMTGARALPGGQAARSRRTSSPVRASGRADESSCYLWAEFLWAIRPGQRPRDTPRPHRDSQTAATSTLHAPNHSCSPPPGGAHTTANSGAANGSLDVSSGACGHACRSLHPCTNADLRPGSVVSCEPA